MLKVKHLSKTISGKCILNDLNFEVARGKIAIFLGESGTGKSTLLRIMNNLESCDEGSFVLDDSPLNLANVHRSYTVGMVFQHFNLFEHLSAEDNLILTLLKCKRKSKKEAEKITKSLLQRYGLSEHAKTNISNLSGGQKQRLAIARTLAVNPKIVCLDEPTSALNPRLVGEIAMHIKELAAEDRIVLLATHDTNLIMQLDGELHLMENGRVIENAMQDELVSSPECYPKLQSFLNGVSA